MSPMARVVHPIPPIPDCQLAGSIAAWVQNAPRHVLLELADSAARADAARELGEIIVAELTMSYPELVDSSAPPLPF